MPLHRTVKYWESGDSDISAHVGVPFGQKLSTQDARVSRAHSARPTPVLTRACGCLVGYVNRVSILLGKSAQPQCLYGLAAIWV